jgi:hypothetical protein
MKRQYLHLSAYQCDKCEGPVISGSIAVRENVPGVWPQASESN